MYFCRSFSLIAALIFFLAAAVQLESQKTAGRRPPQSSAGPRSQDREGIGELQKNEITATMAMDVNNLLDLWSDDAVLLLPRHAPVIGKAALRSFLEGRRVEARL